MTTPEIAAYYESTENREIRADLIFALEHLVGDRVAIDCGCGAGADIAFLRDHGFVVHAFDIEEAAILRCRNRFSGDNNVRLSRDSFSSYVYPEASLLVADASLFFCPGNDFPGVWEKMSDALTDNGIFCGSFLGPRDSMASSAYDKGAYWDDVLVLNEQQIREKLVGYEILKWTEHDVSGESPQGTPHNWHIFSVVAKKKVVPS